MTEPTMRVDACETWRDPRAAIGRIRDHALGVRHPRIAASWCAVADRADARLREARHKVAARIAAELEVTP